MFLLFRGPLAAVVIATLMTCVAAHCTGAPGDLLFKITAPNPVPGAGFGDTLATVDRDLLIGEPGRLDLGIDAPGRAYLFDGRNGVVKFTLNNPEPVNQDRFARALTGGDGRMFVSTGGLTDRVYSYGTATGELLQTIYDPDVSGNNFGISLAYGADSVLVSSAYPPEEALLGAGRAYLFNGLAGQLERTLANPEPKRGDGFGSGNSLAIAGNKVVIGAMLDDFPDDTGPAGANPGRVWVFQRDTGDVLFTIENPNPASVFFDWFGGSLAANNNMIVVGSQEDGTSGVNGSGTVYVFDSDTGSLRHTLFSPQLESNGEFGRSVAITSDGNVLVGAWGTSVSGIDAAGHVYLFDGETGSLLLDIPNPEPAEFALFGWSVAAVDGRIVVGAPSGLQQAGVVYVFADVPEPSAAAIMSLALVAVLVARNCRPSRRLG